MTSKEQLANYMATGMQDYQEGVKIFKDLAVSASENNFFTIKTPNKVHINMLRGKLMNYARVNNIRPQVFAVKETKAVDLKIHKSAGSSPKKSSGKLMVDMNPVVRYEELPALFQEKYKLAGELANQNKTLHAELKQLVDDPSKKDRRAELSQSLISNKQTIRQCWDSIDDWWEVNKEKTKEQRLIDQAAKDAVDKVKRIKANKTYIRRNYGVEKFKAETELRMKELDEWKIDYKEEIEKSDNHTDSTE